MIRPLVTTGMNEWVSGRRASGHVEAPLWLSEVLCALGAGSASTSYRWGGFEYSKTGGRHCYILVLWSITLWLSVVVFFSFLSTWERVRGLSVKCSREARTPPLVSSFSMRLMPSAPDDLDTRFECHPDTFIVSSALSNGLTEIDFLFWKRWGNS